MLRNVNIADSEDEDTQILASQVTKRVALMALSGQLDPSLPDAKADTTFP